MPAFYFSLLQAIQDITQNRSIVPEEIVALIFEKIDVNGEGKHHYTFFFFLH